MSKVNRSCLNETCNNILNNKQKNYCCRTCLYTSKKWKNKLRKNLLKSKKYALRLCTCCENKFRPINYRNRVCKKCKTGNNSDRIRALRYGLTNKQINKIILSQKGSCALCHNKPKFVDHDHKTGKSRGMLCPGCNLAISYVEISGWVKKALKYLEKYEETIIKSKHHRSLVFTKNKEEEL